MSDDVTPPAEPKRQGPPNPYEGMAPREIFKAWHYEPTLWREIYTRTVAGLVVLGVGALGAFIAGVLSFKQTVLFVSPLALLVVGIVRFRWEVRALREGKDPFEYYPRWLIEGRTPFIVSGVLFVGIVAYAIWAGVR